MNTTTNEKWTIPAGTVVLSRDNNTGRVVMETGHSTVVIVWDKSPYDRFIFSERDMKKLGVTF